MARPASMYCASLALALLCATGVQAEESDDPFGLGSEGEDRELEEIIVVAPDPHSRRRLSPVLEDPVRARVLKDLAVLRQDLAETDLIATTAERFSIRTPRIQLGYDPTEDFLRRSEIDFDKPQRETTEAATLFRIGF